MKHRCPICKKIIKATPEKRSEAVKFFPFCSNRCKLIDLGDWFDGRYKVISKSADVTEENPADYQ